MTDKPEFRFNLWAPTREETLWPSCLRVRMEYDRAEWHREDASVRPVPEAEADVPVVLTEERSFRYDALEKMTREAAWRSLAEHSIILGISTRMEYDTPVWFGVDTTPQLAHGLEADAPFIVDARSAR